MGIFDKLSGGLKAITPGPVEDLLFGHDEAPPTPTDPDQARRLIDNVIGREPRDLDIIKKIQAAHMTSPVLTALETSALENLPYDPVTHTRMATGNMQVPVQPYLLADQVLGSWLQADPRRQLLYMRETDPLSPNFLPYVVEANATHHPGLFERFRNNVTDVAGRPIGGLLELVTRPAQEVETWYGSHFVWNDIGDASLRHAMSKYTYESRLNVRDWGMTWEREARQKALEIESSGLAGDAAAAAFDEWVQSSDGHLKTSAFLTDMVGQMIFDPLWFLPTGKFTAGGKAGFKALTGVDDVGRLGRLATAAGRSYAGSHTIKELLQLPETNYAAMKLTSPAARGSLLFLTERNPDRLADAALNLSATALSKPLLDAPSAHERLQVLALYDEVLKTGKVEGRAAELFGDDLLDSPVLAEAQVHIANAAKDGRGSILEGLVEGVQKNPEYLQTEPAEQAYLLLNHVLGNVRSVVRDGQLSVYPAWFSKRYLPMVAAQKAVMGTFTLSRPGFVALNFANNLFTYMWHAAGHPFKGTEIFARSLKAELSTVSKGGGHLPPFFKNLADNAGLDPVAIERSIVGNVSHQDVLGQKLGYPFRLDDEAVDVADVIAKTKHVIGQPLKDMNPRRLRDIIALPVTAAGRIDRVTRRAGFYYNLAEQRFLGRAPEHLLTKGVEGAKGGLLPDIKGDLIAAGVPENLADSAAHAISGRMGQYLRAGNSLSDSSALRRAYLDAANQVLSGTRASRLSAQDLGMRFLRRNGYSDEQALIAMTDLDEPMAKLQEVLDRADEIPITQLKAQIDQIGDEYWTFDRLQAELTHTDPVIRPGNDYSKSLSLTEEGIRTDISDSLMHLERYLNAAAPSWSGNAITLRKVINTAHEYSVGRLNRLADIRRSYIDGLAKGVDKQTLAHDMRVMWADYFSYTDELNLNLFNVVKGEVSKVDLTQIEPVEKWYRNLLKTQKLHRDVISEAVAKGTPEGWAEAGKEVHALYRKMANRRAADFGWDVNEAAMNLGYVRPSAGFTRQVDEYLDFVKSNLGQEMAKEVPEGYVGAMRNLMQQHALEVGKRGPSLARHLVANARIKTDFMMLNYNNQYGLDNALQGVFPYEFFPTRTVMNWGLRAWRSPGAGAVLAKSILLPHEYAKQYGLPDRLAYRVPVPIPFLDNFLENVPIVGDKVKNADFGPVFWIDPMAVLFPMTGFRDDFTDEKKRSTPLGIVADWTEQNTPLSMSPFAKILGGLTGTLDRDAWTTSLFNGGPFGVPLNVYARASLGWIQTGATNGLPESEQELYADKGHFSHNWLAKIIGLAPDRYDKYRTERALASLVASGELEGEEAWEALLMQEGPAWQRASEAADSEKFLADFTGWMGFRIVGAQRGELIRLGEQSLYAKAAAAGKLKEFYEKYPEFEIQQAATKGLSDPAARREMEDNHFYFRDVEELINKPYDQALNAIQLELDGIRNKGTILETDKEREKYLVDELQQIHEEQESMRSVLERAYPNRTKELSLNVAPRERALQQVASSYFDIVREPTESFDDFRARQQQYLSQFPARTSADSEQDWQAIFVAYQTTSARYNLQLNRAYDKGDFDGAEKLKAQRDKDLKALHGIAESRVTRYDVELYLGGFQRILTPGEIEWEQANSLFDLWMSYMSDSSPLTDRQKAAVSAYFRTDPLLRKHYNAATIDIRKLNGDQLLALARRREIKAHYNSLASHAAKVDYIQSVKEEYDEINAMLGLPPIDILDYRPAPPGIAYSDPAWAEEEFSSLDNILDYPEGEGAAPSFMSPTTRTLARSEGGLTIEDVTRYVDPTVQRGY